MANDILKVNQITVEDTEHYTVLKLLHKLIGKINELVYANGDIYDKLDYLLNEGLSEEVIEVLTKWLDDGTLSDIITEEVLVEIDSRLDELENTVINVKNYGAKGDGTTDDSNAIQSAIDAANLGCKVVWIPAGTYKISKTINLQGISKLMGASKIGARVTNIINANNNVYAFSSPIETDHAIEISGLNIETKYGIDLRTNSAYKIKNVNIHDCIFKATTPGGIAIHMNNTDFSLIESNYFEKQFLCHIRVSGYIASTDLIGNKNSTAVQIRGNAFINLPESGTYGTGISVEQVDSVTISENDFCFKGVAIDIGGSNYYNTKIGTINNYNPNSADSNKAIGCTTNVIVEKNHFESYQEGVLVSGGGIANTHDTQIIFNNFQTPLTNSKAIKLIDSPWNTVIERNEIDLKDESTAVGVEINYANRTFVGLNNIYGVTQNFIVYDKTGDSRGYRNVVWEQTEPGKKRDELGWQLPRINVGQITSDKHYLKSSMNAHPNGGNPEMYTEAFKKDLVLAINGKGTIVDFPPYQNAIIRVDAVIYDSYGNENISCTIVQSTVKADNGFHPNIELSIEDNALKIKNVGSTNSASFFVMGRIDIIKY